MMCLFLFEALLKTGFQDASNKSKPLFMSGMNKAVIS